MEFNANSQVAIRIEKVNASQGIQNASVAAFFYNTVFLSGRVINVI